MSRRGAVLGVAAVRPLRRGGMSGGLVVCPTPIGNLDAIALRGAAAVREAV